MSDSYYQIVGGATRMTLFNGLLESTFSLPLRHTLDSDLDASFGMAEVNVVI
jgi:hypothetical protein